ncbi:MAG: hypothetical protein H6747_09660 [Deltaproteobacteria bacterium]|nr:hypothetical protein [Deltaproteobacteria bacterium]
MDDTDNNQAIDIIEFFQLAQDEEDRELAEKQAKREAREAKRLERDQKRVEKENKRRAREEWVKEHAAERGRNWDPERHIPRICRSIVSKWGLPPGYSVEDFEADVTVRLWNNPHDAEMKDGRSWPSWVYLLATSTWKNRLAKATRRTKLLGRQESYEELVEEGRL